MEKISLRLIDLPQPVLGTKDKAKDMIAAIMRIISVTSCTASQSSCRKVFGGFGGIILTPYFAWRVLIWPGSPFKPNHRVYHCKHKVHSTDNHHLSDLKRIPNLYDSDKPVFYY